MLASLLEPGGVKSSSFGTTTFGPSANSPNETSPNLFFSTKTNQPALCRWNALVNCKALFWILQGSTSKIKQFLVRRISASANFCFGKLSWRALFSSNLIFSWQKNVFFPLWLRTSKERKVLTRLQHRLNISFLQKFLQWLKMKTRRGATAFHSFAF